jgi:lipid-A-disaccharide synthase
MHGAALVNEAVRRGEKIKFFGLGGDLMAKAGVELRAHLKQTAVMGLTEVLSSLRRILKLRKYLASLLAAEKPQALLVIDSPDFNFFLAKAAKKEGIPVIYYICPQIWAWRKGRIKYLRDIVDRRAVIFPFEVDFYQNEGLSVDLVGHPLFDELPSDLEKLSARKALGLAEKAKVLAILPGSRRSVASRLTGPMLGAADLLLDKFPDLIPILPRSVALDEQYLQSLVAQASTRVRSVLKIYTGRSQQVLAAATAALLASGTSTVEGSILGTPMVVTYRTSALSFFLARRLVKVPFVSIANLVAKCCVVPELLQESAVPELLAQALLPLLSDTNERKLMLEELAKVAHSLGGPGASGKVLDIILQEIRRHHEPV